MSRLVSKFYYHLLYTLVNPWAHSRFESKSRISSKKQIIIFEINRMKYNFARQMQIYRRIKRTLIFKALINIFKFFYLWKLIINAR